MRPFLPALEMGMFGPLGITTVDIGCPEHGCFADMGTAFIRAGMRAGIVGTLTATDAGIALKCGSITVAEAGTDVDLMGEARTSDTKVDVGSRGADLKAGDVDSRVVTVDIGKLIDLNHLMH